jgi:hypothetical protein
MCSPAASTRCVVPVVSGRALAGPAGPPSGGRPYQTVPEVPQLCQGGKSTPETI